MADPRPNRGMMIVLAYLWPLALVPLLLDREDADVQWHARHGLVLMIAEFVVLCVYVFAASLVSLARFGFGCVMGLVLVFAWVGVMAIHLIAMLKGLNGGRLQVPGVTTFVDRFNREDGRQGSSL
jgi:hypothetical protein